MALPDRLRLPFTFRADLLACDLAALSSIDWIDHFVKQNYQGKWSVLPLRGIAGARHPVMMIYPDPTCRSFADTPMLDLCPYFREVLSTFECPLGPVRLMRLAPASSIKEHTDHDLSFEEGTIRLHIPITTNDGVDFHLNRSRVIMEAGSTWYLRLSDPHSVCNNGSTDRVHMIIDAKVNDWWRAVLASAPRLQPRGSAVGESGTQP